MSNNQYRKPVLTSTEEFVTTQGIFKRIITMYKRVLSIKGSLVLKNDSFLDDELFIHALGSKFGQENFKGSIDFNEDKVPFEINLEVTDEDGNEVEFYKLGIHTRNYIFERLIKAPKCCEFKFSDYGRDHKYVLNDQTYEHTTDIEAAIGKEETERIKAELFALANTFDSFN